MSQWDRCFDYNVAVPDGSRVQLYQDRNNFDTIIVGSPVKDARWANDKTVTVYLENGAVRKYKSKDSYTTVRS